MGKWWAGLTLIWLLIAPSGSFAEEPDEPEALEGVVVTATRLQQPLKEVASSVTVIPGEEVERRQEPSVLELLREVPALDVVQAGGPGRQTSVMIRGAGDGQTLVLIDGIEMNDPISPSRSFDFANLTTDNIERIEIVRGPQSTLYGSDAAGGVINIITKKGKGELKAEASAEAGTYETYLTRAGISGATQQFNYSLGASYQESEGISAARAKGFTLEGERYKNPEKDGYRNASMSSRAGWMPLPNLEVDLFIRYIQAQTDLDNFGGKGGDDPNAEQETKQLFSRAQVKLSLLGGLWEQKLGVSYSDQHRDFLNPKDEDHPTESETSFYDGRMTKFDWQHNLFLHPTNTLTLGAEYESETGRSKDEYEAFGFSMETKFPRKEARTRSLYLQDEVKLWDSLFATAGLRFDDHSRFGSQTTWRLAPAYLVEATRTKIKGSYGTGFKAPTLYQLYSQYGDKALEPEKSQGWDVGVEQDLFGPILSLGITYFHNNFEDLIDFDLGTNKYVNLSEAETKGVECFASLRPLEGLILKGTYTRTDAEDQKTHLTLLRRPRDKFSFEANYHFLGKGNINLVYLYVGKRVDNDFSTYPAARVTLDHYVLVNLAASYDLCPHFQIYGRVQNLLNEDYEEVRGYGTWGRSVFFGLKFSL